MARKPRLTNRTDPAPAGVPDLCTCQAWESQAGYGGSQRTEYHPVRIPGLRQLV
jgi:hypothetical protein